MFVLLVLMTNASAQERLPSLPPVPPPEPVPTAQLPQVYSPTVGADSMVGVRDLTPPTMPGRGASCAICEQPEEHSSAGVYTSAEYLLMRARRPDLRFALVDPTNDLTPNGATQVLSPETRSGFRVGFGYKLESGWSVGVGYTYYRTTDTSAITAAPGGTLYPLLTRPGLIDNVNTIAADSLLDYHVFDLEFGKWVKLDEHLAVRGYTGVQFASIGQDLNGQYNGGDARNASTQMKMDFDGAGPMVGGESHWVFGNGLSFFGRGRASLLYGNQKTSLNEVNDGGATLNASFTDKFSQLVPMANLGLGVAWQYRMIRASVGYEVTNWFGLVQSPSLGDDFAEGKVQYRQGDLALEGFFLQLGLTY